MGRRVRAAVCVVVVAVGAGACSDGSGQLPVDYERACTLLSDGEAAEVMGVDVHPGEPDFDRTIPASYCEWIVRGGDTSEGGEPAYSLFVSEGSDEDSLDEFERRRRAEDATEVEDLGDAAYFELPGDDDIPFLHVRVDNHVTSIGASGDDEHPVDAARARKLELEAAAFVVGRL